MIKEKIEFVCDGKKIECEKGETILSALKSAKISVPTLCYLKDVLEEGNCRICMVELFGGKLVPACSTKVTAGMQILSGSEKVVASRKKTLELILSNHHKDCDACQKNGSCSLQALCLEYGISDSENKGKKQEYEIDNSSSCIVRDNNKCILCGRCESICSVTQKTHALTKQKRGFETFLGCAYNQDLKSSTCVGCGQCTLVCPTGALMEKDEIADVENLLKDKSNFVIAQVAPSVRVSLAEHFGESIGSFDEGRMVSALKKLGFAKVFDVNLGADFTVCEESEELLERIKENKNLPLFSSCCPAWFKFVHTFFPEQTNLLSSCKSPTEMLGSIVKNFYAKQEGIPIDKIKVVGIMPCTAKKGEKERGQDVDCVLTTRETARMIEKNCIDYQNLKNEEFDSPLSNYSSAGLIFGVTGGVTEAVLRTVVEKIAGEEIAELDFLDVRKSNGRKEAKIVCGEKTLNLCIVNGLANAKKVVQDIACGKKKYHFVEVMACPGGCVNGGGQNFVDYSKIEVKDVKKLRAASLFEKDKTMQVRQSHKNMDVQKIYSDFFIPTKNSAKNLLHYKTEE
ncbi:MAG: [FeFe] hydrogenase, group A [Clostridia bacterium]